MCTCQNFFLNISQWYVMKITYNNEFKKHFSQNKIFVEYTSLKYFTRFNFSWKFSVCIRGNLDTYYKKLVIYVLECWFIKVLEYVY